MSNNILNDISKVYFEQVVAVEEGVRPGNVETPLDKAAFKKRRRSLAGKEKSAEARARGHEGKTWTDSGRTYSPDEAKSRRAKMSDYSRQARYQTAEDPDSDNADTYPASKTKNLKKLRKQKAMGESAVPGKPAERLGAVSGIPQDEREAARQRTLAKSAAIRAKKGITQEGLDPVGKEDADIDNDGKSNTKKDKYLMNRRNVIKQELATQKEAKEVKKWWDDDGDGKGYEKGEVSGKFKKKKKEVKEGYSNWREDLSEVIMTDKESDKKISEKKVNNKVVINPKLRIGEAIQNLGGELIEMIEIDEKTLTAPETKKKEEIVKSMKKNLSGFKSRYGDRAKEVMYATATKQAKKVAEAVSATASAPQPVQQPTTQTAQTPNPANSAALKSKIAAQTPNPANSAALKSKIAAQKKELMARKAYLAAQQSQLGKGVSLATESSKNSAKKVMVVGERIEFDEPEGQTVSEGPEDALRDKRMERGGVDGNIDYNRPANTAPAKKRTPEEIKQREKEVMDKVRQSIIARHGKNALM